MPRVFWRYLIRTGHPLASKFPNYEDLEDFFTRPRSSLTEYIELHSMVEGVQRLNTLDYFVSKLVRGAYVFESICYLELRHTPYYRTDREKTVSQRIAQMRDVVRTVGASGVQREYPLLMRQILCMHSRLSLEINRAILDVAAAMRGLVCGIDLAGPDTLYGGKLDELLELFRYAKSLGLKTTGHLYETENGCHPDLLPYLDRIGHGIQIPLRFPHLLPELAARGQCLEVCPTTYLKTGTMKDITELRTVFDVCGREGVDIVLCTDNAGLHNVRLPFEIEMLLTQDIIDFKRLRECQDAAFKHAFAWPSHLPPERELTKLSFPSPQIA